MGDEHVTAARVGDRSGGGRGACPAAATYRAAIGSQQADLPVVALDGERAIALMMTIDLGVRFTAVAAAELAGVLAPARPQLIVSVATLGIPVAFEVSRCLGLDDYLILQKSPKVHLRDCLRESAGSITSTATQQLLLDRRRIDCVRGRRVAFVDDVISTGASAAAALRLLRRAGAEVVAIGALLTESDAWRPALGEDAGLVQALGQIPLFRPGPQGGWIPHRG
jgi:adenine/guanine phosphoribosyltransferase-like PRPP-binding protein